MKRPTIADIARRAGVSKVAVSYALNGQRGVSKETRAHIQAIADEIGWRPNSAARMLNGARSRTIGLALCRPARVLGVEPFFMELVSGIESSLAAQSYGLLLQVVADHQQEMAVYNRWWGEGRVDGAFLVDLHVDDPRVKELEAMRMPVVVIGHPESAGSLANVWSNDDGAVYETVRYLARLGHRAIARVSGPTLFHHTGIRDLAFDLACQRLGLPALKTIRTDYTGEAGAQATRDLLETETSRPTAIVYDNDIMAIAGLSVAQELRIEIPSQLSIVAWDDSPLTRVVHPPLTALTRDIAKYGAHAATRLLALIGGERGVSYEDQSPRLTPRGSTAPPAK